MTNDANFPITGDTVALTSSDPAEKISALTDNKDGTYTATITSSSTLGPATITATDTLTPANTTPVMNITAQATLNQTAGVAAAVVVNLSQPPSIVANGSSTITVTARVTDAQGRALPGEPLDAAHGFSFSSSDTGQKIGPVTDNKDGTYTATITSSTTVGITTITATDRTSSPNASGSARLTQTAGPATSVRVKLTPSSIVANGSSKSTTTAVVTDAQGHPLAGDRLSFSSSDAGERIGPVSDNNGTYSATITSSTTPGSMTITATDSSVSPRVSGHAVLKQTAAAPWTRSLRKWASPARW